jgi:hypothetical protein
LLSAYEGLKEREARIPFLWRKKRPAESGARIVALYDAWGKTDRAAVWRKKLGDLKLTKGADPDLARDGSK